MYGIESNQNYAAAAAIHLCDECNISSYKSTRKYSSKIGWKFMSIDKRTLFTPISMFKHNRTEKAKKRLQAQNTIKEKKSDETK